LLARDLAQGLRLAGFEIEQREFAAHLTLARRIAGAVLAMWKNKEKYDPTRQQ
jgi:2'-5' RNA ligase